MFYKESVRIRSVENPDVKSYEFAQCLFLLCMWDDLVGVNGDKECRICIAWPRMIEMREKNICPERPSLKMHQELHSSTPFTSTRPTCACIATGGPWSCVGLPHQHFCFPSHGRGVTEPQSMEPVVADLTFHLHCSEHDMKGTHRYPNTILPIWPLNPSQNKSWHN